MAKLRVRDQFGVFRKNYTVHLEQLLVSVAEELQEEVTKDIEDQLLKTYKKNVQESYVTPAKENPYVHTGTFMNSIYTVVEDNVIKVKIRDDEYPHRNTKRTAPEVYGYLRSDGKNRRKHFFEEHTSEQMNGYLAQIRAEIKAGTYLTVRQQKNKIARENYRLRQNLAKKKGGG